MSMHVAIGVGCGHDDPVNVVDEVTLCVVNEKFLQSVQCGGLADPLAAVEQGLHEHYWLAAVLIEEYGLTMKIISKTLHET